MQHKLKPAAHYDGEHDSTFDAVRQMIANEANERRAYAAPVSPPKRPLAQGLSHAALAPAHPPQMRERPTLVSDRPGPHSDADRAQPNLKNLRGSKAARAKSGWLRSALGGGVLLAVLAALAMNPVFSASLLALLIGFGVTSYITMGYDGFWHRALRPVRWYVARHPDRAAHVYARIDRFACRWDMLLDLCPERMVAALYLPDIADIAAVAEQDKTPIDLRLSGLTG